MAHITERLGPIDYEVIEFPGGIVTGAGFRRIVELSDAARILVLDIKFLSKSADGHVVTTSAHDLGEIDGVDMGFFDGAASCLLEDGLTMRLLRTATHAAVASNVHNKVSRRQQAQWAQQTAAAPAAAAAPPAVAPAAAAADDMSAKLEQLKQLGELRDAGILTPEEFDAKKAIILG